MNIEIEQTGGVSPDLGEDSHCCINRLLMMITKEVKQSKTDANTQNKTQKYTKNREDTEQRNSHETYVTTSNSVKAYLLSLL